MHGVDTNFSVLLFGCGRVRLNELNPTQKPSIYIFMWTLGSSKYNALLDT